MKRSQLLGLVICLLATSIIGVNRASAAPVTPPSVGCILSNMMTTLAGAGATMANQFFFDDDTLTFTTGAPVNFHITNAYGLNYSRNNVTSLTYNIPVTGTYTYSITPTNGKQTSLSLGCKSTPISGGCIVSNDNFVGSMSLVSQEYNAGEVLKITSDNPVNITVTGAAIASYTATTSKTITFAVTGLYTIKIVSSTKSVAHGQVSCTLPRRGIAILGSTTLKNP